MKLSFKDLLVLLMGFIIGVAVTAKASENSVAQRFSLLSQQTPVPDQGDRDTSASFTAVALLESLLKHQSGIQHGAVGGVRLLGGSIQNPRRDRNRFFGGCFERASNVGYAF